MNVVFLVGDNKLLGFICMDLMEEEGGVVDLGYGFVVWVEEGFMEDFRIVRCVWYKWLFLWISRGFLVLLRSFSLLLMDWIMLG